MEARGELGRGVRSSDALVGCVLWSCTCGLGLVHLLRVMRVVLKGILFWLCSFSVYKIVDHGKPRYFSVL